jgi:hypothetical protein
MVQFETNLPYASRIQMTLGSLTGPLTSTTLGAFTPRRDLIFYLDGQRLPVQTSYFDVVNNRYLIFMTKTFDLQGLIQVVHHMPNPNFLDTSNTPLDSFSYIASYSIDGDAPSGNTDTIAVSMSVFPPSPVFVGQPLTFLFEATGVAGVAITTSDGWQSGPVIAVNQFGVVSKPLGFTTAGTFQATITGLDALGNALGSPAMITIVVS